MNIVLDTLASARNLRWLGHALGLGSYLALCAAGYGGEMAWTLVLWAGAALLVAELIFSLFDARARRLKRLAPTAFPFKKMEAGDRAFLQNALGSLPHLSVGRAFAAWALMGAWLHVQGVSFAGLALLLGAGAAPSAFAQGLGNAVMLSRVLPFFYFEESYAGGLSRWLPSLGERLSFSIQVPVLIVLPPLAVLVLLGQPLTLPLLGVIAALALLWAFACAKLLHPLVEQPLLDLAAALSRLKQGDLDALLDVTDGGAVGQATEAYNQALRAVDRRLFLLEKFHHAVMPGRSEGMLEELKLDGERRPVAVLCARWIDAEAGLRAKEPRERLSALSRFYEGVQDAVDRHQGCTFVLDDGFVLAIWGAPFNEDGAVQGALGAAWDLQTLLPVLGRQLAQRDQVAFRWGLGVASGQATAGLAGPRGRERYSVQGGPVPEARALSAREGGAWLDERSAGAAKAPFGVQIGGDGARLIDGPVPPAPDPAVLGFQPGERL
jgi:hypothetical protein